MKASRKLLLAAGTFLPSSLRLWVWRRMGFDVGVGCRVSPGSVVIAEHIELGHGAVIEPLTFVFKPRRFVMGERARISAFVRIIGYGEMEMKAQSFLALGVLIDTSGGFVLGARSAIGPRSMLYTHGAAPHVFTVGFGDRNGPITIGEDAWISMGCIVYPRITIGDRALISPGTVVSVNVPADRAIFPAPAAYTVVSSQVATLNVDRAAALDHVFETFASVVGEHTVDTSREAEWILDIAGLGKVVFVRDAAKATTAAYDPQRTVVWRLEGADDKLLTFEFSALRVLGGWNEFAERIASVLCDAVGMPFRFEQRP